MSSAHDKPEQLISIREIAEQAGVSTPAVSNWRRRFDDFPDLVPNTPGRVQMFRRSEINQWLERHNKPVLSETGLEPLRTAVDILRSDLSPEDLSAVTCAAIAERALESLPARSHQASAPVEDSPASDETHNQPLQPAELLEPLAKIGDSELKELRRGVSELDPSSLADAFEWSMTIGKARFHSEFSSTGTYSEIASELAIGAEGTFLDPACGQGGFLIEVAQASGGSVRIVGIEKNREAALIAAQRAVAHGIEGVEIYVADSLLDDPVPHLSADLIITDPPWGLKVDWKRSKLQGEWPIPPRKSGRTDLAWAQYAIGHLDPEGSAFVFTPVSSLLRRGGEGQIRVELIRTGAARAVVQLPPGLAARTSIPSALWRLGSPNSKELPASVVVARVDDPFEGTGPGQTTRSGTKIHTIRHLDSDFAATLAMADPESISEKLATYAIAVPRLDLLGDGAELLPSKWLSTSLPDEVLTAAADSLAEQLSRSHDRAQRLADAEFSLPTDRDGWRGLVQEVTTVDDLLRDGRLEQYWGVEVDHHDWTGDETGVPLVSEFSLDLSPDGEDGLKSLQHSGTRVTEELIESLGSQVSKAGDLVISAGTELEAWVDETGGHALESPLTGLRIIGDWISPTLLAGLLEICAPLAAEGAAIRRVRFKSVLVPIPAAERSGELEEVVSCLAQMDAVGSALAKGSEHGRQDLLKLLMGSR